MGVSSLQLPRPLPLPLHQGSFQHRTELWIVMEYCSGGSVADLIAVEGEPLREDIIAFICSEALKVRSRGVGAMARQWGRRRGGPL